MSLRELEKAINGFPIFEEYNYNRIHRKKRTLFWKDAVDAHKKVEACFLQLKQQLKDKAVCAKDVADELDDIEETFLSECGNMLIDRVPKPACDVITKAQNDKWIRLSDLGVGEEGDIH